MIFSWDRIVGLKKIFCTTLFFFTPCTPSQPAWKQVVEDTPVAPCAAIPLCVSLCVWHRHIWVRRDSALLCCLDLYSSAKSVQNQPYHSLWLCRTDTYESGGPGTLPYRFVEIFRFKIKYSIIQVYFRQAHDTFSGTKTRLELCISQKICDLISTELPIVGKEVVSSNIPISCKRGMMQVMIFFGHFLELLHIYVLCTCSCHRTASCGPLLYTSLQMLSLSLFDRLL